MQRAFLRHMDQLVWRLDVVMLLKPLGKLHWFVLTAAIERQTVLCTTLAVDQGLRVCSDAMSLLRGVCSVVEVRESDAVHLGLVVRNVLQV